jgi:hypothetical protein
MHLVGPALTTTGKKKGKQKFRNADQARKSRELDESWKALQKKWSFEQDERKRNRGLAAEPWKPISEPYRRDTGPKIHSLNSPDCCGVATKSPEKVYTGTNILGIATMHKSNAVPVFSSKDAEDISKMRR